MSDYDAAIHSAALFDRSHAGKLVLTGADAPMFLGNLSTNDIKNLPLGGGCEAYFCDSRAKVQFQTWIYHTHQNTMWVETTPGRNEALAKYLDRYLISERVEIADRTDEFAQFHLAGPQAKALLEKALGETLPELEHFQDHRSGSRQTSVLTLRRNSGEFRYDESENALAEFANLERTFALRRRDPLGLPGFDLVVPKELAVETTQRLTAVGAIPGSAETYETLRIEAGTPLFGPDIDENRFVMEVGNAARAVSYTKGCFLGQEPIVMARDRAGHVNRAFLGMKVLDGGPLPPGTKLFREGQEVGQVTSSCHSPRLGLPVALGYLRWKHQEPGTRLEAETKQIVEVVGLPPVK